MIGGTGKQRKRLRLKQYDYSQPGAYFVTICTKDREHRFGEIVEGEMWANGMAAVVQSRWNDLPNHYPNVELDEFVIMPNHVHGIIVILDKPVTVGDPTVGDGAKPLDQPAVAATSRRPNTGAGSPRPYLGNVVAYFKYQSAKRINEINGTPSTPVWQRGYYDHIIRDDRSLTRIREYIAHNPQRWASDKQNPDSEANDEFERWLSSTGKRPIQEGTQ
ncbi:MAG: hypothetical protein NTZ35_10710 [Ignavibacteriales bacterium]|nr:hypothetical protein [Ignavibacteriales bacterium]